MKPPLNEAQLRVRRTLLYATIGAFVGSAWGAWSLASRGADRATVTTQAQPPTAPDCPLGYVRASGYDHTAIVDNSNIRWLVRCDPIHNESVLSESLEMFWVPEVLVDPRLRPEALQRFVTTLTQSSHIALEPMSTPQRNTTSTQNENLTVDAQGGFLLPTLKARAWALPASGHTVLVTLVAPEAQMSTAESSVVNTVLSVQGLAAFAEADAPTRSWNIAVQCPPGWTDATHANGGNSASLYVGRYCLAPSAMGGAELTFAEVASRAQGSQGARQLFALAATMMRAVGTQVSPNTQADASAPSTSHNLADFAAPNEITVGAVTGFTATASIEPPPAQVSVRGWLATAGNGTVYALGTALKEREAPMRIAITQFANNSHLQQSYAPQLVQRRKGERLKGFVLIPGVVTALLGALIGWFSSGKKPENTND